MGAVNEHVRLKGDRLIHIFAVPFTRVQGDFFSCLPCAGNLCSGISDITGAADPKPVSDLLAPVTPEDDRAEG